MAARASWGLIHSAPSSLPARVVSGFSLSRSRSHRLSPTSRLKPASAFDSKTAACCPCPAFCPLHHLLLHLSSASTPHLSARLFRGRPSTPYASHFYLPPNSRSSDFHSLCASNSFRAKLGRSRASPLISFLPLDIRIASAKTF